MLEIEEAFDFKFQITGLDNHNDDEESETFDVSSILGMDKTGF